LNRDLTVAGIEGLGRGRRRGREGTPLLEKGTKSRACLGINGATFVKKLEDLTVDRTEGGTQIRTICGWPRKT